jgi:hypothetical protein
MGMKQSQRRQGPGVALALEVDEAILEPHTGAPPYFTWQMPDVGHGGVIQIYIMMND